MIDKFCFANILHYSSKMPKSRESRAELSNLEWYYYQTNTTTPHHHMCHYNIELFNSDCHNPGLTRAELFNLEW